MKYLEITLKPSGPHFLGNNRSPIREETSRQPYFLTSNRMPSQATLPKTTIIVKQGTPYSYAIITPNAEIA